VIDEVLAAATPERTLVHGIHTAPAVVPVREGAVLLGDAAHAMAPNLGHGANTALVDAAALTEALAEASGPSAALRRYVLRRTLPGQAWRLGSAMMMRLAMLETDAPLRDRLLGAAPLGARPGS
jgi:2-polyprenyl-6-methoxyphenol hydroxylase-like FAD-dependent oxidoreductase